MGCKVVLFLFLLACVGGCSNLDFGRSPISFLTDVGDSDTPVVPQSSEADAQQRLARLEQTLGEWEKRVTSTTPSDYHIGPSDVLSMSVFSLEKPGEWAALERPVDLTGKVRLPLIGDVEVGTLTVNAAEERIRQAYEGRFIKEPQVRLSVKEYRSAPVLITGAVSSPGMYYLKREESSVLEMLYEAGGLSSDAGGQLFIVRRSEDAAVSADEGFSDSVPSPGEPASEPAPSDVPPDEPLLQDPASPMSTTTGPGELLSASPDGSLAAEVEENMAGATGTVATAEAAVPPDDQARRSEMAKAMVERGLDELPALTGQKVIPVDLRLLIDEGNVMLNLPVRKGDVLSVPAEKNEYIYVLGYVKIPGRRSYNRGEALTALNALAIAGGPLSTARVENSYLIRQQDGTNTIVEIDLLKIARGIRPDVPMQPGDTLVVGSGLFMKILEFFKVGGNVTYAPLTP